VSETEGIQPAPPIPDYDIPVVKTIPVPPDRLSSLGRRLADYLLTIVLFIVTLGIGYLIWSIVFCWKQGMTPAKKILGMQVVNSKTGQPCTWSQMAMRDVIWTIVLGIIPLGTLIDAIMLITSGTRQRLLDRMAGTLVIDVPK
jgi:uncharacterized RDD family membrane protein YckC